MTDELAFRSIRRHQQALAAREYSAVELTEHFLRRIERYSPVFSSYMTVAAEAAREEAQRADAALARGERAPLLGVPLALKDNYATAGLRTTAGSRVLEGWRPMEDAWSVALLRQAGAVILGKTHLSEFASGPNVFGPMRNPWNAEHFAGGSSGGSASAVAAGLAVAALGSDTGGSIRIPAAFCGLVGLKPTYGRVSLRGVIPAAWTLDHAGPMTRTVEDAALLLNVLAAPDPDDPTHAQHAAEDFARWIGRGMAGLRIGKPERWFFEDVDNAVRGPVEAAIAELAAAGATIVPVDIPMAVHTQEIIQILMGVEVAAYQGPRLMDRAAPYNEAFRRRYLAASLLPGGDYLLAQRARQVYRAGFAAAMAGVDLLVTPAVRIPPPRATASQPGDTYLINGRPVADRSYALSSFTAPFDLTGLPAISLPCGQTADGLPVGFQLAGHPFAEALLVQVAAGYESRAGGFPRPALPEE